MPTTDIFAHGDDLVIRCELAGVEPDEVDISLSRGVLSIGGERNPRADQAADVDYYTRERRFGSFRRSITLPESVARDDLRASLENGLLEILVVGGAAGDDVERIEIGRRRGAHVRAGRRGAAGRRTMMRRTRVRAVATALVLAAFVAACGSSGNERGSSQPQGAELNLTLGTKDFTESFIVGQLYRQALAANGYNVRLRRNIGSTEVVDEALQDGDIDAYPEYLGVASTVVAGADVEGKSTTGDVRHRPRLLQVTRAGAQHADARTRTSTRSPRLGTSPSATASAPSATCAGCGSSRSARDPSSRVASRGSRACRLCTG